MMVSLLLIFALVLGIAGGFLLYYDRTQRAPDARGDTGSQQDTSSQYGPDIQRHDSGAGETDNPLPERSPGGRTPHDREDEGNREGRDAPSHARAEAGAGLAGEAGADGEASAEAHSGFAVKYSPSPDIESDSFSANSSGEHHRTASDSERSGGDGANADRAHTEAVADHTRASESQAPSGTDVEKNTAATTGEAGLDGAPHLDTDAKSKPVGRPRPLIPGALRRERKHWAETRGFEYMKSDHYLVDEWTRGVASSGAAPKNIVAGNAYGHEMLLMDIDGVNVMAMRTGAASDVVMDFQRCDSQKTAMSEDLLLAMRIEGFDVYSSDRGVTERMVDDRVRIALQRMPEVVSALWLETEWVLAQTTKHSRTADWEAMLPPLALLADSSRVLPPRSSSVRALDLEDLDPARDIPAAPMIEALGGTGPVGEPEFSRPVIQRPEEPLDMPSRTYSQTRGMVEHTAIGADEVGAIADGNERPTPDSGTARLPRRQLGEASIFGNASDKSHGSLSDGGLDAASPDDTGQIAARGKDRRDDSRSQEGE
ncbi:hypothetical protein GWO72_05065 [Corynebacterium macginleyi]|nr:hypothetical protein [Corynebacterium macginleyi]